MTEPMACPACARRSDDGLVCARCTRFAVNDLAAIAGLWPDLEVTLTRQARVGGPAGRRSRLHVAPVPFHEAAATVVGDVRFALVAWMAAFDLGDTLPSTNPAPICRWLADRANRWRGHPEGHLFADEIGDCARRVVRVIDAPPVTIYLGTCDEITDVRTDDDGYDHEILCQTELYARPSDLTHECRVCHTVYDVPARRTEIVRRSMASAATVNVCTKLLAAFGLPVTSDTIQNWARPKRRRNHETGQMETVAPPRLSSVGKNTMGQRLYHIADVETLARESMEIREAKRRRGA
jgi:hypothetical protein